MSDIQSIDNNIIQSDDIIVDDICMSDDPVIFHDKTCIDSKTGNTVYNCELSDDLRFINGFRDDGIKARYSFEKKEWFYGCDIGKLYVIPFNQLDPEEHKKLCSAGGKKTQEGIHKQRTLNEIAKDMLNATMRERQIDDILGDAKNLIGDDTTAGAVMIAKMIQTAMSGSFKAAEFVRDTAGYKPKNEVSIEGELITDNDRSLMDKIGKRLELTG